MQSLEATRDGRRIIVEMCQGDDFVLLPWVIESIAKLRADVAGDDRVVNRLIFLKLTHAFWPSRVLLRISYDANRWFVGGLAWWALQEIFGLSEAQRRVRGAIPAVLWAAARRRRSRRRLRRERHGRSNATTDPAADSASADDPRQTPRDSEGVSLVPPASTRRWRHLVQRWCGAAIVFFGWVLVASCATTVFFGPLPKSVLSTGWMFNRICLALTIVAGRWLVVQGRRLAPGDGWYLVATHPDEFVLYLRSFTDDGSSDSTGYRNPLFSLFVSRRTSEEELVRALEPLGAVVAVAAPDGRLPPSGAARIHLEEQDWRQSVPALMRRARLVVLRVGYGEGFQQELEWARNIAHPERLLLFVPQTRWHEFVSLQGETVGFATLLDQLMRDRMRLDVNLRHIEQCPLIGFGPDWRPIGYWPPSDVPGHYFSLSRIAGFRSALGPLYESMDASPTRGRGRRLLFAVGVLAAVASLLAVLARTCPALRLV